MAGLLGIDVSSHQGSVDWAAVKGAGVAYGFTKLTGGTDYRNPYAAEAWAGMKAQGLVRGAYHYALEPSMHEMPGAGPEAEADVFCDALEALGIEAGDLAVLDVEEGDGSSQMGEWALRWLARAEDRLGWRPMVYTGAWFSTPAGFGACPELAGYPLWLAAYQESMPMPAPPWDAITIWQYTSSASIAGVATPCDGNLFSGTAAELAGYGAAQRLPEYDWQEPARLQENDWDCSPESMEWCLYAYGRTPDDNWIEESMIAEDVVSVEAGCLDASGAGLAAWLTRHYGPDGYVGSNDPEVSFDAVVEEAGQGLYPVAIGGRAWYHWSGVRGYDDGADLLLLANPAPGWQGVYQTMTRAQFAQLGPFSLVRLRHPAAEGDVETPPLDYSPWAGRIGSGLLEMMAADGVLPAQRYSTWLPLGAPPPADIEECVGTNGITYRWLLTENLGFRIRPS